MGGQITFITGNPWKAKQVAQHLNFPVHHQSIDLDEIQSLDLDKVISHKANEAFRAINRPVLVEDISLSFNTWGRLPGTFIKWFLQEIGNEGLCHLLNGYSDRAALVEVMYGYHDGKKLRTYSAQTKGTIAQKPRGKGGFGWDPIFIPNGYNKTRAEMTEEEHAASSARRLALQKLEADLELQSAYK